MTQDGRFADDQPFLEAAIEQARLGEAAGSHTPETRRRGDAEGAHASGGIIGG